jgi:murein DD-endopeptidase MepM/ murein hydrolase activator NlpD
MMRRAALMALAPLLLAAGDPATDTEHVVEQGETLRGIANRAGVPAVVIAEANGLAEPYVVKTGQKLLIPRQRSHEVKAGDTLGGIAERYRVPAAQIALANGLDEQGTVRIGRKLIIPALLPEREATSVAQPYFRRPHDGKVLLGWRRRPDGGGHEGIDFAVAPGDMIRAAASGTVVVAGDEPERFGKLVVIDHGTGWQSAYGHLARVSVSAGDAIRAGERIGIGGQGGTASRPELHFEIRHGGEPADPGPLLREAAGG